MKKTLIATALLSLAQIALAQEGTYNFEAAGLVQSYTSTGGGSESTKGAQGIYYFSPLKVEADEPYFERAFVQKVSNVTLQYAVTSFESSTFVKTDINLTKIAGELHINNFVFSVTNSGLKSGLALKAATQYSYDIKNDATGYLIGYYLAPKNLISISQDVSKATYTRSSVALVNQPDYTITKTGITSKNLFKLNQEQFAVLSLDYRNTNYKNALDQSNNSYGISGRYYPSKATYLQAGYSSAQGDKKDYVGNTLSLEFGVAINPRMGVTFSSSQFNISDSAQGSNDITNAIFFGYRF